MESILSLGETQIVQKWDALGPDQTFIIQDDQDPMPLYYQLLRERGEVFTWKYIKDGPDFYEVKVGRIDNAPSLETIGEIVANDFRKAQVFKKLGIDFCCGGKKTLKEVCDAKGIDIQTLKAKLFEMQNREQGAFLNYDSWDISFLADYIVHTHHSYVKESLPFILDLASKVAHAHGLNYPEVIEVNDVFNKLSKDFELHMIKEESILFPFIKELASVDRDVIEQSKDSIKHIHLPTEDLEIEHEQAGDDMKLIRKITSNYNLPQNACTSFTILYKKLQEFENDLFKHVHLENNILFPKAIKLEKDLLNACAKQL